jgi:hypothetical protein
MIKQAETITPAVKATFETAIVKLQAEKAEMLAVLRAGVNDKVLMLDGVGGTCIAMIDGKPEARHAHKATAFTAKNAPMFRNGVGTPYNLVCRAHAISKGIESIDAGLKYMQEAVSLPVAA